MLRSGPCVRAIRIFEMDIEVSRLKLLKANHLSQRYALEDQIIHQFPKEIRNLEQRVEGYTYDIQRVEASSHPNKDGFSPMEIEGTVYAEKKRQAPRFWKPAVP